MCHLCDRRDAHELYERIEKTVTSEQLDRSDRIATDIVRLMDAETASLQEGVLAIASFFEMFVVKAYNDNPMAQAFHTPEDHAGVQAELLYILCYKAAQAAAETLQSQTHERD